MRYGGLSARAFAEEIELYVARYGKGMSEEEHGAIAWLESAAADGLEWHRGKQPKLTLTLALNPALTPTPTPIPYTLYPIPYN